MGPETQSTRNRPVGITQGGITADFAYGPDGERFRKIRGGATTLWLGPDIELLPDGTLLEQVGEIGRIAGMLGSGGVREWLHRDGLASNRLMTDAAGIRVQHSHYLSYGDRSSPLTVDENGGPAAPERIGFIGERGELDTNLLYLNARWYDPVLGRFLTPDWWDPTIPGVGTNRYAYAGNDPVNASDRSGHWFGLDDSLGAAIGALLEMGSQRAEHGRVTDWSAVGREAWYGTTFGLQEN